jgi:23S rRNA-/tRNA-specific pseudouridylate synthase
MHAAAASPFRAPSGSSVAALPHTSPAPIDRKAAPRLVHIIAETQSSLAELIRSQVSPADPDDLIRLGAVYRRRRGDLSEGAPNNSVADATRVLMNVDVSPGDYVRVHLTPRRYATDHINWASKVVYEDEDFVVVNKPSGLPAVPTGDNYLENVRYCMERHLKISKLYSTHRLDTDTSGLILLGKTPEFASTFSRLMRDGHVRKVYRTLVAASTEVALKGLEGPLVHYTPIESRPLPKLFLSLPSEGSRRCEAQVVRATSPRRLTFDQCDASIWPNTEIEEKHRQKLFIALQNYFKTYRKRHSAVSELVFVDAQVELITGRTHQVRGQIHAFESSADAKTRMTGQANTEESSPTVRSVHVAGDNMYRGPSSHVSPDSRYMGSPFLALQVRPAAARHSCACLF